VPEICAYPEEVSHSTLIIALVAIACFDREIELHKFPDAADSNSWIKYTDWTSNPVILYIKIILYSGNDHEICIFETIKKKEKR